MVVRIETEDGTVGYAQEPLRKTIAFTIEKEITPLLLGKIIGSLKFCGGARR